MNEKDFRKTAYIVLKIAEKVEGLSHIVCGADAFTEDINILFKRLDIIISIVDAERKGLYELSEHLASKLDLESPALLLYNELRQLLLDGRENGNFVGAAGGKEEEQLLDIMDIVWYEMTEEERNSI